MKFLCPSCKAKYQIADEKVIGRTVKMKCRHCGHLIEINEVVISDTAVPTGSTSTGAAPTGAAPTAAPITGVAPNRPAPIGSASALAEIGKNESTSAVDGHSAQLKPPPKPQRSLAPVREHDAGQPKGGNPNGGEARSSLGAAMGDNPRRTAAPRQRSAIPRPQAATGAAPQRTTEAVPSGQPVGVSPQSAPQGGVVASPKPVQQADPDRLAPGKSRAEAKGALPAPEAKAVAGNARGVPRAAATKPITAPENPLAGAFAKAVSARQSPATTEHPLAGDEWYVGVGDQPIGPIRLSELRDRAASGEINATCLVWRDGFEDWKPLSAFPELVAVVEEGRGELQPAPLAQVKAEPLAPSVSVARPATPAAPMEPIAPPPKPAVQVGPEIEEEDHSQLPGLPKARIPMAAWLAVGMALALGIAIGLVVIKPEPAKPVIKYVEVPAAKQASTGELAIPPANEANNQRSADATKGDAVALSDRRSGASNKRGASNAASEGASASGSGELTQGLKGLAALQGAGVPRSGPSTDQGSVSSQHQQLDSATLSRTVSRYTASVKRSCWQPALDTRAPDASTSARISANIVVAASGKVQSVTVSPDPKGYRGLSSCIQARVRNWEFPPAGGSTEFNVPFVFAAQ